MHANKWRVLFLALALLLVGCGGQFPFDPLVSPTPTPFARPVAQTATTAASAESSTDVPTPNSTPTLTAVPPTPTDTPTATDTPGPTPTATATPTLPPPLPLRDDLPPLALKDWPRPAGDNGLGIHFLASGYYSAAELDKEIARMQALHLKWALVIYADENYLDLAAQKFKAAGIMVVWRKTLHPYQRYLSWGRDIDILNKDGMPPYMQLYNEPEVPAEWDTQPIDSNQFMNNLMQAVKDVYNAGGYPGVQFVDDNTLRDFITQVYARQGDALFHRMFFVAHSYGLNHPPDYTEDANGVLGFIPYAQIFQRRLGFIPPIIVGEGGWKVGESEDNRFPTIDETLHRDYTLAVFNWFQTGKMSNGKPLPDYLFAYCMWMLAGNDEAGAWFDSFNGDRTLTIQAVEQLPTFVRKFSWDK